MSATGKLTGDRFILKDTITGWLFTVFFFGLFVGLDYWHRLSDKDVHTGGIDATAPYVLGISLIISIAFWLRGSKKLKLFPRIFLLLLQVCGFLGFWFFFSLFYVCTTGIDCL